MIKFIKHLYERGMIFGEMKPVVEALNRQKRAMQAKDAELYEQIKGLPISAGRDIWRERYPEDLTNQLVVDSTIVPR